MNPLGLASAEWRAQRLAFWGVSLLLALALAFALTVQWTERGLRQASIETAQRFDLLVGVAGSPTQMVLSALYLQPQALALLPARVGQALAQDAGVVQRIPLAMGDAVGPYPVVGSSAALISGGRYFSVAQGRAFAAPDEAVVGSDVKHTLGEHIALHHGAPSHGGARGEAGDDQHPGELRVVGRLAPTGSPWDRAVLVPVALLWSLHGQGQAKLTEQVPLWLVRPRSVADAYRLRQTWRRDGVMAVFPAEVLAELLGQLGDARQVLGWVAAGTQGLVLCAGLLTVAVLLATRRQAHAVLRALGAPRAYLLAMNWLLAMGVGWRACVLALPMALAMAWAAAGAVQRSTGLLVHITPQWADLALPATLLAASALGATVLAWQACSRPVMGELNS